jgi:hypothetical protein
LRDEEEKEGMDNGLQIDNSIGGNVKSELQANLKGRQTNLARHGFVMEK